MATACNFHNARQPLRARPPGLHGLGGRRQHHRDPQHQRGRQERRQLRRLDDVRVGQRSLALRDVHGLVGQRRDLPVEAEDRALKLKIKSLEATLESRERILREDETELIRASQDVLQAKADLQKLREEFTKLKRKLQQVEKEDLDTLRAIVLALEKLLDSGP